MNKSIIVFLILSLAACKQEKTVLPYYNSPNFSPQFLEDQQLALHKVDHQIADFALTNQKGQQITQKNIEGRIHIANFMFTSCGSICPFMTKNLKAVQEKFYNSPQVTLLSFSITPWIDDVDQLKQYAQNNQITAENWHLLTGNKKEIYDLARQSYFVEENLGYSLDSTDFLHTEHILLVDQHKRIRGIYNGTLALEINQLIEDIKVLIK